MKFYYLLLTFLIIILGGKCIDLCIVLSIYLSVYVRHIVTYLYHNVSVYNVDSIFVILSILITIKIKYRPLET